MKKQTQLIPTVSKYTILRQISNLIPAHLVPKLARETGVAEQERTFSAWSQMMALMFAHLTHAIGLNDVCDALRLNRGPLKEFRPQRQAVQRSVNCWVESDFKSASCGSHAPHAFIHIID